MPKMYADVVSWEEKYMLCYFLKIKSDEEICELMGYLLKIKSDTCRLMCYRLKMESDVEIWELMYYLLKMKNDWENMYAVLSSDNEKWCRNMYADVSSSADAKWCRNMYADNVIFWRWKVVYKWTSCCII